MSEMQKVESTARSMSGGLGFDRTGELLSTLYGWRPLPHSRALVKLLSHTVRPLEHGSYSGRSLAGGPHRSSWVIAGPLTVFTLPRAGYRNRLVLAARLRHMGELNVLELPRGKGERSAGRATAGRESRRRRRAFEELARAGMVSDDGVEYASGLAALLAVQRASRFALTVVPVAETSHQLSREAPPMTVSSRFSRLSPVNLLRKSSSLARLTRTGRLKNTRPLTLKDWMASHESAARGDGVDALRLELANRVQSECRACEGPPHVPKREVGRRVLSDPMLAAYMGQFALDEGRPREDVLAEARGYLDEIASDYRVGVVRWFARAVDMLFDRFLTGLDVDRQGVRFITECDSRSRLVLVCSHKSYLDPLLIGYTLFRSGMVPPQQAAGKNLDFWPVGWLLRHSGAFYLRRSFAGETLYREVFRAYVRYLLAENFVIVLYIEGTRSRDGKLAAPKTGFMTLLADALDVGVCPDITLVPTYLGYDKVPEESAHVREMAGGRKKGESVKGFARIYRSLNTRLGCAYVKFGHPMSMRGLLASGDVTSAAEAACREVDRVTPVSARSIAAAALLASGAARVPLADVEDAALTLFEHCVATGAPLSDGPEDLEGALRWFEQEGRIALETEDGVDHYIVEGEGRRHLAYNRALIAGHFVTRGLESFDEPGSGTTVAVGDRSFDSRSEFLRTLFAREFTLPDAMGPGMQQQCLSPMLQNATEVTGTVVAKREEFVIASMLVPLVESYLAAAASLEMLAGGSAVTRSAFVERCFEEGERIRRAGGSAREESLSRVAYTNACKRFCDLGLFEEERTPDGQGKEEVLLRAGRLFCDRGDLERAIFSCLPHDVR